MQKDYAPKAQRKSRGRTKRSASRSFALGAFSLGPLGPLGAFSPGSFVAGVVCCAVVAVAIDHAAAVAAWFGGTAPSEAVAAPQAAAAPALTYEFMQRLPSEVVRADAAPYEGAAPADAADQVYLLQAASFPRREDADAMRAELLLDGMDATVSALRRRGGGAWHRVLVGPFANHTEMRRARTKLRAKDIPALPLVRAAVQPTGAVERRG